MYENECFFLMCHSDVALHELRLVSVYKVTKIPQTAAIGCYMWHFFTDKVNVTRCIYANMSSSSSSLRGFSSMWAARARLARSRTTMVSCERRLSSARLMLGDT